MDNEMKAKVEELLKNVQGRRELSMDEMDKVVGGTGACFRADDIRTEDDLNYYVFTFLGSMEKAYGKDVVEAYVKSDFKVMDAVNEYNGAGLDGLHNFLGQRLIDRINS